MKKLILLFIAILAFQTSDASHAAGGEIWYEHDTLNTYTVHFRLYRDCSGIGAPASAQLYYRSNSLSAAPINLSMSQDTFYLANNCGINTCISPVALIPGFEVYEYSTSISLSAPANDWYFWVYVSARNPSQNSSVGSLYVDATLDNLNTPFNNSAVPYLPIDMLQVFNTQTTMNFPLLDIDGDSLDINFSNPLDGNFLGVPANLAWQTGYSTNNPFGSTPAPMLNSSNGNLTMYNSVNGLMTFAVTVDEYRNGIQIASSVRDYQFVYGSTTTNSSPTLSGVNGTTSYVSSINVCPSSSLSFTVNSADPNPADITTITPQYVPTGASFTSNTAQNAVGTFTWTPTLADVRSQPYILSLKVKDNNCAVQSFGYQIFVNNCNPDSVWAGDANADFTCDNYDILNIGIANGQTGAVRAGATTNWQAEWCANWTNNFISNINQKHADCNGDGVVDASDLAAVTANYGLVHVKTGNVGQYKTAGLPDLYCDMTNVQAHKGSTVTIPVMLGTSGSVIDDFYGISATVELLNAQTSAPISISKNTSWIGNASNSFEFEKSLATNKAAFTFVRNDQTNLMAQHGQIGEITFPIDASSINGSEVTVQFSDIKIIKNSGEEINDFNVLADKLTILAPLAVSDIEKGFTATVYPNPTKSNMTIVLNIDKTQSYEIALYDVVGRLIDNNIFNGQLNAGEHNLELDLTGKSIGQYQLEITSENGKTVLPIQKR